MCWQVFLIDDAGAEEIDDGVSVEDLPDGCFVLWAHIADPSRMLAPGGASPFNIWLRL